MSTTESTHPVDQLDDAVFSNAARQISSDVRQFGYGEYVLVPGDATRYPFIFLPPNREVLGSIPHECRVSNDWMVIYAGSHGCAYPWGGRQMRWDYCADKWCQDRHEWTGRVVARLLNAVSDEWARVHPEG